MNQEMSMSMKSLLGEDMDNYAEPPRHLGATL